MLAGSKVRGTNTSTYIDAETALGAGLLRLIATVLAVYGHWATAVCGGQTLTNVGLKTEAYFKFFNAPDFLTPRAGLVQIRAYAQRNTGESSVGRSDFQGRGASQDRCGTPHYRGRSEKIPVAPNHSPARGER